MYMGSNRQLFLVILLLFSFRMGFSQTGTYFMTHYNPAEHNFDNSNYEYYQDNRGVVHIANRQGVLHYDGNSWWLTPIPFSVYCLAEYDGKIYVGGREGFGYVSKSLLGQDFYVPIDTINRDIEKIVFNNNQGYYLNEDKLLRFNIDDPTIVSELETNGLELLDIQNIEDHLYVSTNNGLHEVDNDAGINLIDFGPEGSLFIRKSTTGQILYFTDSSQFYTQQKGVIRKLAFQNNTLNTY